MQIFWIELFSKLRNGFKRKKRCWVQWQNWHRGPPTLIQQWLNMLVILLLPLIVSFLLIRLMENNCVCPFCINGFFFFFIWSVIVACCVLRWDYFSLLPLWVLQSFKFQDYFASCHSFVFLQAEFFVVFSSHFCSPSFCCCPSGMCRTGSFLPLDHGIFRKNYRECAQGQKKIMSAVHQLNLIHRTLQLHKSK